LNSQKYWYGTSLSFSGNQSTYFYKTIKEKGLDWEILNFDNTSLSRIDLYYDRKFKKGDEIENFDSFLEECRSQIEKTDKRKIAIVDKGVLQVGRRGSGNYFRVYRRPNGKDIRFELELTKSAVKNFEFYLFSNQFEKLEELLCIHFYKQALTTFMMDSCYTDWLLIACSRHFTITLDAGIFFPTIASLTICSVNFLTIIFGVSGMMKLIFSCSI